MLGLPASTEIHMIITRKKLYEQFGAELTPERKKSFEADIARMVLTNEISPVSLNIAAGEEVQSFFVMQVTLKNERFDAQNIALLTRLFGQRLVLVLEYNGRQRLALWQTRLLLGDWAEADSLRLELRGTNLDRVWEQAVSQVAGLELAPGENLDTALATSDRRARLQREIERLDRKAKSERQPRKKYELVQQLRKKQAELDSLSR